MKRKNQKAPGSPDAGRKASSIRVDVLGDSAWFSKLGRSISYKVTVGAGAYLIDCGAPPFQPLGMEGLGNIRALFVTHSHDDHRRWFTDLALFTFYNPALDAPIHLYTTEIVHEEFHKNSKAALERSLNLTSDRLVDLPYDKFVQSHVLGPRARYRIERHPRDAVERFEWRVYDEETGREADPGLAKVVINPAANRPRMLFKDPETEHWVEPEAYYDLDDPTFYFEQKNDFYDEETGLRVRAIKAAAWHGPPVIGLLLETETEKVAFSSDTIFDPALWRRMAEEIRTPELPMSAEDFAKAPVVQGDINLMLQRTWSRRRFEHALKAFNGSLVIHDADYAGTVVHTAYDVLAGAYSLGEVDWKRLLLCHTPDRYVSAFPIISRGKTILIEGGEVHELAGGKHTREFDADIYVKEHDRYYAGYISREGGHEVYREKGGLKVRPAGSAKPGDPPTELRVQLYCDIGGRYFAMIDPEREAYIPRPGGDYEHITFDAKGSRGKPATDLRQTLRTTPRKRRGSKTGILGKQ